MSEQTEVTRSLEELATAAAVAFESKGLLEVSPAEYNLLRNVDPDEWEALVPPRAVTATPGPYAWLPTPRVPLKVVVDFPAPRLPPRTIAEFDDRVLLVGCHPDCKIMRDQPNGAVALAHVTDCPRFPESSAKNPMGVPGVQIALDPSVLDRIKANQAKHVNDQLDEESEVEAEERHWAQFVPSRFRDARLGQLDDATRGFVDEWLADPTRNLLISGQLGVGKTHTAFAICRALRVMGKSVRWHPAVELLDGLRPGGAVDLASVLEVPFLFIDDLGGEKASDWTAERLYLIVNRRWLENRPIIATSNLEPAALRTAVGERTYDRLRHGALGLSVQGESRRG